MIQSIIGKIWRIMPRRLRILISRLPQTKFTISAGGIVFSEDGRVLLLNHVLRPTSGWGIPGGFIKAGEQPLKGLHREIREETGIEIKNAEMISVWTNERHLEIIFRCEGSGEPRVLSSEITEAVWFAFADIPAEMENSQKILIETAIRHRKKRVN